MLKYNINMKEEERLCKAY